MKTMTEKIKNRYNRNAPFYDFMEGLIEFGRYSAWRRDMFGDLHGHVLEIGVGTGKNIAYYPEGIRVTAIDISASMMIRARKRKASRNINFALMDAQQLALQDNSFDFVVDTFVLCSIPDPVRALREMKRVVKPEGKIISMEHVLSTSPLIAGLENLITPLTRLIAGAEMNRNTRKNIELAGLAIIEDLHLGFHDIFRRFTSRPV